MLENFKSQNLMISIADEYLLSTYIVLYCVHSYWGYKQNMNLALSRLITPTSLQHTILELLKNTHEKARE